MAILKFGECVIFEMPGYNIVATVIKMPYNRATLLFETGTNAAIFGLLRTLIPNIQEEFRSIRMPYTWYSFFKFHNRTQLTKAVNFVFKELARIKK